MGESIIKIKEIKYSFEDPGFLKDIYTQSNNMLFIKYTSIKKNGSL